ncbi:MAG: transketolase [Bacteroidales bacterium]|nr:transketolase [Bacteroidales bacterium]
MDYTIVNRAADNIRVLSAAMVEKARSGHPGGAMGGADFINILYSEFLHFDPDDLNWPFRDRFFLDPGHMSPMLYSVLSFFEIFTMDDLKSFRQWKSCTPGHPELDLAHGIENTSGPLGQGHAMAVGAAIAEKFLAARFGDWMSHNIYTFISDGGIQEEIGQGAGRIAGHLGLNNLVMFYDSNDIQLSTKVDEVTSEDTAAKYKSWGWRVVTIDGNDPGEIRKALKLAYEEREQPFLIIGKTAMGKGCLTEDGQSFEYQLSTHGQPISNAGASPQKTIAALGGDAENPFEIFSDVKLHYEAVMEEKRKYVRKKRREYEAWCKKNPALAGTLDRIIRGEIRSFPFENIFLKPNSPTRAASGAVLASFSGQIENMIVISADLSNSDKTEGFLKNTRPITRSDFSGAFLHAGVSELTMAAIANGMALHYIIPVCGTFFVFSDYMKPAVRMAALMELPVKYVWTHDSFRVGEDGPTHQPVEHEAQIRLLEKIKNHSGRSSLMVLRPADGAETLAAWKMALENTLTPTALILSRQAIKDLPSVTVQARYDEAQMSAKGAYTVARTSESPELVLFASGSEVSTLVEAATILKNENGVGARVVSVISSGLFSSQPESYRKSIFPENIPAIGLTAGLPDSLAGVARNSQHIIGLDHFGYSAPYTVLDMQFGFTPEEIVKKIRAIINL